MLNDLFSRWHSRTLRKAIGQYAGPAVIREMKRRRWDFTLPGSTWNATLLAVRVKGLRGEQSAENHFRIANEVQEAFSEIVFGEMGILPPSPFGEMLACFGFPIEQGDQAQRAGRAALKLGAAFEDLNERWKHHGDPWLRLEMGIHSGEVWPGFSGFGRRWDLTLLGGEVHLAPTMWRINFSFGTQTVLSEDAQARLGPEFLTRELGRFIVKGRSYPMLLYELAIVADPHSPAGCGLLETHARYRAALDHFYQGRFSEALRLFRENPSDLPSGYMERECVERERSPVPPDWDGTLSLYIGQGFGK